MGAFWQALALSSPSTEGDVGVRKVPSWLAHVRDLATMNPQSDAGNGSEPVGVEGDLGAMLDARATAQCRGRLAEARQELYEAPRQEISDRPRARGRKFETITETPHRRLRARRPAPHGRRARRTPAQGGGTE